VEISYKETVVLILLEKLCSLTRSTLGILLQIGDDFLEVILCGEDLFHELVFFDPQDHSILTLADAGFLVCAYFFIDFQVPQYLSQLNGFIGGVFSDASTLLGAKCVAGAFLPALNLFIEIELALEDNVDISDGFFFIVNNAVIAHLHFLHQIDDRLHRVPIQ
jgi:hypothetical protein